MTRRTRTMTVLMAAALVSVLTACGPIEPSPTPTPTATSVIGEQVQDDPFDAVGQAADGGTFEPLVVPDGMPHGAGVTVDADWLTRTGDVPALGQTISVTLPRTDSPSTPTVLLSIDDVTEPIDGDERAWVLENEGVSANSDLVVQQVTLRIREVANDGDSSGWDLTGALNPLNNAGDTMSLRAYEESPYGCHGDGLPFAEHGLLTNDTVQACLYVIGSVVSNPDVWLNSIQILSVVDGASSPVVIRSDVFEMGAEDGE